MKESLTLKWLRQPLGLSGFRIRLADLSQARGSVDSPSLHTESCNSIVYFVPLEVLD